ncbi:hypothetical protein C8Q79DRAFT_918868 [Trametes meyenii]|nr:hypothetical protein C8Q79DRAFT_918868 [Trametes meyenii]
MLSAIGVNLALTCIESMLFGIFFVLAATSLAVLVVRHSNNAGSVNVHAPLSSERIWKSPLFVTTLLLLMTVSAHWVISVRRIFEAFLYKDGGERALAYWLTVEEPTQVAATTFVISSVIVGDIILTYRIWVVWDRRLSLIIFPTLCTLGYAAMGISVIQLFASYVPGESIFIHAAQRRIITTAALTLTTNIYGTAVSIAYRIWSSNRALKHEHASPGMGLTEALTIFIESAALYTSWTLFFLVSYSANSLLEAFAFHCIPAATGISFMLIIVRVGLGFHWSPASGGSALAPSIGVGALASARAGPPRGQDPGGYPMRVIHLNVTRTVEQEAVTDYALRRGPEKGLDADEDSDIAKVEV